MEDTTLFEEIIMQYHDIKAMKDFMVRFNNILTSSTSETQMLVSLIILKEQIPHLNYFSQDLSNIDKTLNDLIAGLISIDEQIKLNNDFIKELVMTLSLFNVEAIEQILAKYSK